MKAKELEPILLRDWKTFALYMDKIQGEMWAPALDNRACQHCSEFTMWRVYNSLAAHPELAFIAVCFKCRDAYRASKGEQL